MKPQTQNPKARMNKKGQFGINALYVLVFGGLILSLAGIILSIFGLHIITTENGTHTGFVTAIETNGWLFKTDSIYFKTDAQSSQEDKYCIIDKQLKEKLREYQENNTRVTIEFYNWMFSGVKYCKGSDIAIVSGVKE